MGAQLKRILPALDQSGKGETGPAGRNALVADPGRGGRSRHADLHRICADGCRGMGGQGGPVLNETMEQSRTKGGARCLARRQSIRRHVWQHRQPAQREEPVSSERRKLQEQQLFGCDRSVHPPFQYQLGRRGYPAQALMLSVDGPSLADCGDGFSLRGVSSKAAICATVWTWPWDGITSYAGLHRGHQRETRSARHTHPFCQHDPDKTGGNVPCALRNAHQSKPPLASLRPMISDRRLTDIIPLVARPSMRGACYAARTMDAGCRCG
jgi:hypothetical protein